MAAPQHFRRHPVHYSGIDELPGGLLLISIGVGTYLGGADAATDEKVAQAIIQVRLQGRALMPRIIPSRRCHPFPPPILLFLLPWIACPPSGAPSCSPHAAVGAGGVECGPGICWA